MNDDYGWPRNVRWDFNGLGLSKVITDLSALTWRATYRARRSLRGNVTTPSAMFRPAALVRNETGRVDPHRIWRNCDRQD